MSCQELCSTHRSLPTSAAAGVFSNPEAKFDAQAGGHAPPLACDPETTEEDAPAWVPAAPEPAGGRRWALPSCASGHGGAEEGDAESRLRRKGGN